MNHNKRPHPQSNDHGHLSAKAPRTSYNSSPQQSAPVKHAPIGSYSPATSTTPAQQVPDLPPISDPEIAQAVFTHADFSTSESKSNSDVSPPAGQNHVSKLPKKQRNYESLEFLGDAYLEILATRLIFSRYPSLATGRQAQLREKLVWNVQLKQFADAYGFGNRIRMTEHTWFKMLDKKRDKVLADVFEAYVAGVVLDDSVSGFEKAEKWMTALWEWSGLLKEAEVRHTQAVADAVQSKDQLLRLVGGKEVKIDYVVERASINADSVKQHEHRVNVQLTGWGLEKRKLGEGVGCSIKEAGQRAAADAIEGESKELVEELAAKKKAADEERRARLAKEAAAREQ